MSVMMTAIAESPDAQSNNSNAVSIVTLGLDGATWDKLLIWALALAALVAGAVVVATAGSIITHKREAEAAEDSLQRYKETVAAKVADAKSEGIKAGSTASNALERAGRLEKEAAEARERAANLELQIAKIREPRAIVESHKGHLIQELKLFSETPFELASTDGDPEARNFMLALGNELISANWKLHDWTGNTIRYPLSNGIFYGNTTNEGIVVYVHQEKANSLVQPAEALVKSLNGLGISSAVEVGDWKPLAEGGSDLSIDHIHILVGRK